MRDLFQKELEQASTSDILEFIDALKADDILKPNGEPYADTTKVDFFKIGKPFFAWLHQDDKEFASWIKTGSYQPLSDR